MKVKVPRMDRRTFLIEASVIGIALTSPYSFAKLKSTFSTTDEVTLRALSEYLLPSEPGTPGACEINGVDYLQGVLADSKLDKASRMFLLKGIRNLERVSYRETQKHFFDLSHDEREKVLRALEATKAGYRWLKEILEFLMEALLSDPVYGGNTGEAGWKWLHHTVGFPRPPQNKRYFLL